jgi:hypothetical protein
MGSAFRNVAHLGVLAGWSLAGVAFTLSALSAGFSGLGAVAGWWVWFAGLAAVTSYLVLRTRSGVGALLVHAGTVLLLLALPALPGLRLLRLGLDLLQVRA